jgi:hypothetical protein
MDSTILFLFNFAKLCLGCFVSPVHNTAEMIDSTGLTCEQFEEVLCLTSGLNEIAAVCNNLRFVFPQSLDIKR